MQHVVIDANVLVSFFYRRNESQRRAAKELLQRAENGEIAVILPQFVLFEVAHVFRNFYGVSARDIAKVLHAAMTFPGVLPTDDCPWNDVLEHWPGPFSSITDAAIVAIAMTNRHGAVATFDEKLVKRMKQLGVNPYW